MLRKRLLRRSLAGFLVVLGGALMFLAPSLSETPGIGVGLGVLLLGVLVELAGIAMERRG